MRTRLKTWLGLSVATFLLLLLIHLALPALFLLFQIPSFTVGQQVWIFRWQNDKTGSGLQFNLIVLLTIAVATGLLLMLVKTKQKRSL